MELEPLAAMLGVKIKESDDLHPGIDGIYLHQHRAIVIRRGLDPWVERSVLAHELGHAYYSDEPTPDPVRDARQEARANRWAANLLLAGQDVEKALICNGNHIKPAAYELEVTATILRVWLEMQKKGP